MALESCTALTNKYNNFKDDCWDSKPTSGFDGYGYYDDGITGLRRLSHDQWSWCALSCDELAKTNLCYSSWNDLFCFKDQRSKINVRDTCKMSCNHEDCQGILKYQGFFRGEHTRVRRSRKRSTHNSTFSSCNRL